MAAKKLPKMPRPKEWPDPPSRITTFDLGAKKYSVEYVVRDDVLLGKAMSGLCKIRISESYGGDKIPESAKGQTLIHEVVHCILDDIGREDLSNDEKFVQTFSVLLHQFIETRA